MIQQLEYALPGIRDFCRKDGIGKLFVFGSALDEKRFGPGSDMDFLFKLRADVALLPAEERPDVLEMTLALSELLDRRVDLIDLTRVSNPYFIADVNEKKVKIYEA